MKYQTTGTHEVLYAEEASRSPHHHHSRPVPPPQTRPGPGYDEQPSSVTPSYNEMQFFERVQLAIDNRDVYNEFLKLINLFTQEIIDMRRLIEQSRTFLGEELLAQFKEILGWDSGWESNSAGVNGEGMERISKEYLNVRNGPSYRRLPASVSRVLL